MIDALLQGKLSAAPTERTGKSGKPFVTARLRVAVTESEALFASVVAFDEQPAKTLMALREGDALAVAGALKLGVWTDREGNTKPSIDVVAHQVLTVYQVRHRRAAVQPEHHPHDQQQRGQHQRPRDEAWRAMAPTDRQYPPHDGLDDGGPLSF